MGHYKLGPPKLKLDERQIRKLAEIQCTNEEIASVMGCSADTLERRYAEVIKDGRRIGCSSLRKAQWDKALKEKDTRMMIWLGRFYLGQKEEMVINSSEPDVKALLEKWEVVAKKKSHFQRAQEAKDSDKEIDAE